MSNIAVFPGQGSQSVGMLADCADNAIVRDTFVEASEVLGLDLWLLCQDGPAEKLNQTEYTQPALLTASVALWRLYQAQGCVQPIAMAGHSLGEYSALVAAGALTFADAVRLVNKRGQLMQQAVPAGEGAMAAILGLEPEAVAQLCADNAEGESLSPANINAPGQIVIAGAAAAVERAVANAKAAGAKLAKPLPVSVPSHCELMRPAAEALAAELESVEIKAPTIPVYHNASAATEADPEAIRQRLVEQLYSPVRWVECAQQMFALGGAELCVEIGAGNVLTGLNKRVQRGFPLKTINSQASFDAFLADQ